MSIAIVYQPLMKKVLELLSQKKSTGPPEMLDNGNWSDPNCGSRTVIDLADQLTTWL